MVQAKCIGRYRDKHGKLVGYKLQDSNNAIKDMESSEVKLAIRSGKLRVSNLTLTSDGRLIFKEAFNPVKTRQNIVKAASAKNPMESVVANAADVIYKALGMQAKEIVAFDNSYDGNVDKRYEPEILYKSQQCILAISYFKDDNSFWISLEGSYSDDNLLEINCLANRKEIDTLVRKFIKYIKPGVR